MPSEITTERLRLRIPNESDIDSYVTFYADAAASVFYGGPLDPVGAFKKLCQDVGHWTLRGYGLWTVTQGDDDICIGGCGIVWPIGWPRPELTWWTAPAMRRQGIAKEASQAVIDWAYQNGWEQVQTHMKDENAAARHLVITLGGTKIAREEFPDGETRDVFALPRPISG